METRFNEFKVEPSLCHFWLVRNNFLMFLSKQGSDKSGPPCWFWERSFFFPEEQIGLSHTVEKSTFSTSYTYTRSISNAKKTQIQNHFTLDSFVSLGSLPNLHFLFFYQWPSDKNSFGRLNNRKQCMLTIRLEIMDKYWYLKLAFNTSSDLCCSTEIQNHCRQEWKVDSLLSHHFISSNISITLFF